MKQNTTSYCALAFVFVVSVMLKPADAQAVVIPTVPVGNPGNAADPSTGNVYGSVSYEYRIGTTEVTNAQYVEFLNAKASSDSLGLYSTSMASNPLGGITRTGPSGSYAYSVKAGMANKPVVYVNFYDAIRFANWLHNGQGAGDTETGAYTLLGGTAIPSNRSFARNPDAIWFLPSENEWYKAAYHQPSAQGGDADDYWVYPTASNSTPTIATANSLGDISNPGLNVANYALGADWNNQDGNLTSVGSAGPLSNGFYGTADQGGNAYEWNDTLMSDGITRGLGGGSWSDNATAMQASQRAGNFGTTQNSSIGFRVATVPEPGSMILALIGGTFGWFLQRRLS